MWSPDFHANMNFPAPLAVMGFLGGLGGLFLAGVGSVVAWFAKQPRYLPWIGRAVAVCAAIYLGLFATFSLASKDHTLARGEEKYFCEIDCHLAYAVTDVQSTAEGDKQRYIVTLRTRFDEKTTSATRPKDAPFHPWDRRVELHDDRGRVFPLGAMSGTPMTKTLIPAEAYTTQLTFDAPRDATGLRLLVTTPDPVSWFLIGDENTLGHGKTYFGL